MSVRKITEFYQMRRNSKHEENGIKRRMAGGEAQEESNTTETVGTTVKRSCRRPTLVETSPLTQPQKEIFWNTVSPECAFRLQPRAMDENQIQQTVVTTIKSYGLDANPEPKPSECGILDSWLNRTETVATQPATTPKTQHGNWPNRSRTTKPKPSISAIKLFLENANVDNKSDQSTSHAVPAKSSDKTEDGSPDFEDMWEEEELFNNTDFLEATQKLESKYKGAKITPPLTVTASTSKFIESESVNNLRQVNSTVVNPVGQIACKKTVIREIGSNSSSFVDAGNPATSDNASKCVTKAEKQASNTIPKADSVKEEVLHAASHDNYDDDDEIERIMCTLECPSNSLFDIQNAPTQILHHSGSEFAPASSTTNVANNSFVFDSDDSFGADFDV